MKKIKQLILFTTIIYGMISCNYGLTIQDRDVFLYEETKQLYPEYLTGHLPDLREGICLGYRLTTPHSKLVNLIGVIMEYDKERVNEIEQNAIQNSLKDFRFAEKYIMMVEGDEMKYKKFRPTILLDYEKGILPIPNFNFVYNKTFFNKFYPNATIYVLDSDNIMLFDEETLPKQVSGLPKEWQHGFSRGIAISGNIVVYWIQSW